MGDQTQGQPGAAVAEYGAHPAHQGQPGPDTGPPEVQPRHRHARDQKRHPGQDRILSGEQKLDQAVGTGDPGQRVGGDDGVRPGPVLDGLLHQVQDLRKDERSGGGDERKRRDPHPVQGQNGEEEHPVEAQDHVDRGVQSAQSVTEHHEDDGSDHDSPHGLATGAPGPGARTAGDDDQRETGEQREQGGGAAPRRLQQEPHRSAHAHIGADVDGVHAEDREAPGQVDTDQPLRRGRARGSSRRRARGNCGTSRLQLGCHLARHRERWVRRHASSLCRTSGTDHRVPFRRHPADGPKPTRPAGRGHPHRPAGTVRPIGGNTSGSLADGPLRGRHRTAGMRRAERT